MKGIFWAISAIFLLAATGQARGFTLASPDIGNRLSIKQVFSGYGCAGENISPELTWRNPPAGTKSFAITVFDPDAPTGRGWWHWLIFDIPREVTGLKSGAGDLKGARAPAGSIQSLNDFGTAGYGGACPPRGDKPHRYIFTVYALDVAKLGLDSGTKPAQVEATLNRHALARASLTTRYAR